MPRGKKYDAAEKHFREKELKLNKDLRAAHDRSAALEAENARLKEENEALRTINEAIIKAANMTEADVKTFLEHARTGKRLMDFLDLGFNFGLFK